MSNTRCMDCMQEYDDSMQVCPHCGYRRNQPKKELYYLDEETILAGRYLCGKVMSEDSFGITYIAWDLLEECKVVIKEYLPKDCATRNMSQTEVVAYDGEKGAKFADGLAAYLETAEGLTRVSENVEGIVSIKNSFIENSTGYYVMEYLDGVSLSDVLKGGKMKWNDIISILTPVMISLQKIHNVGLGNYNISPDNIVMTRSREVKLRGFESVNLNDEDNRKQKKATTEFSAYEMYRTDAAITSKADVYSMAAVIYYAVTGVKPPLAVDRYSKDTLQPPSKLGIKIPQNAETALMNALNVEARYRTKSMIDFLNEINSKTSVKRISAPKRKSDSGKLSKKAKIIIAAAAAVTACVIVGIVMNFVFSGNDVNTETIKIPDFSGLNYYNDTKKINEKIDIINKQLKEKGIDKKISLKKHIGIKNQVASKQGNAGDIVSQTPEKDSQYEVGKIIKYGIKVSIIKPKDKYKLPDFCNGKYTLNKVKKWCAKKGIGFKDGGKEYNDENKKGIVISQEPNAGSIVYTQKTNENGKTIRERSDVTVVVSKGPRPKPKPTQPQTTRPTRPNNNWNNNWNNNNNRRNNNNSNSSRSSSSRSSSSRNNTPWDATTP